MAHLQQQPDQSENTSSLVPTTSTVEAITHPSPDPNPIAELQSIFGTLLLVTRDPGSRRTSRTRRSASSVREHRWNGIFELFSFPRELRDIIYSYYLHSPKGVEYTRSWAQTRHWPFSESARLSLFLVSRQVYDEALQIFLRETVVNLAYRPQPAGVFRLFPEKPARMVQRIRIPYRAYGPYSAREWSSMRLRWADIISHSLIAKEHFPALKEYTAGWTIYNHYLQEAGLYSGEDYQEQVTMWTQWLRDCYEIDHVVPPKWLSVEVEPLYRGGESSTRTDSFMAALNAFRKELDGRRDKEDTDIEMSGKKWLEEMWGNETKTRKKNKKSRRIAST